MHYLYRITNSLNNKVYIGQAVNPNRRWVDHKWNSKQSEPIQYISRAMAKYGIENFVFEIIASCQTQESANETESLLIKQYDSRNPEFGYNLMIGGSYGGHSEETIEKIRQATIKQIAEKGHPAQGHKWTDEQKAKLSETLKALDKDAIYTPEVRKNMSDAHKGLLFSEEKKQKISKSNKTNWAKRQAEMLASGEFKCNAPGCEINGVNIKYRIINDTRYCVLHGDRVMRTGFLELQPRSNPNKGKKWTDEQKDKLKGRKAHNKVIFTEEQINYILSSPQSTKKLAKEFGFTEKVIARVRKNQGN